MDEMALGAAVCASRPGEAAAQQALPRGCSLALPAAGAVLYSPPLAALKMGSQRVPGRWRYAADRSCASAPHPAPRLQARPRQILSKGDRSSTGKSSAGFGMAEILTRFFLAKAHGPPGARPPARRAARGAQREGPARRPAEAQGRAGPDEPGAARPPGVRASPTSCPR